METTGTIIKHDEQWTEIRFGDKVILNVADIWEVTRNVYVIEDMEVPKQVPPEGDLKGLEKAALPNHVKKCKADVQQWDGLRKDMSRVAGDLQAFCQDSLVALEELETTSKKVDGPDFANWDRKQRESHRAEMQGMFQDLRDTARSNEKRAGKMADDLGAFAALLRKDSTEAERIKRYYQEFIDTTDKDIRRWAEEKGITLSEDVVADIQAKVNSIIDEIKDHEAKRIAAMTGASVSGAATLVLPILIIFTIPGVIVGSVFAGLEEEARAEAAKRLTEAQEQVAKAGRLNQLRFWFASEDKTFRELTNALDAAKDHVNNLRGKWQGIANELGLLTDDTQTGKLDLLKKADWMQPISKFGALTVKRIYEDVAKEAKGFQYVAFREPKVEKLKLAA